MTRMYSIEEGYNRETRKVHHWCLSRKGDAEDWELRDAFFALSTPGDGKKTCVFFTPTPINFRNAEVMRNIRIRNMKKRAAKNPMFAPQIEAREMKRDYFSIEHCQKCRDKKKAYEKRWIENFWKEYSQEKELKFEDLNT